MNRFILIVSVCIQGHRGYSLKLFYGTENMYGEANPGHVEF